MQIFSINSINSSSIPRNHSPRLPKLHCSIQQVRENVRFSRLHICPVYMFGNKATSGYMVPRPGDLNILNIGFQGFGLDSGPNPLTLFFFHEDCLAARRYGKTWQNKVFLNSLNALSGPQSLVTGRQRQSSIKKDTKHSRVFYQQNFKRNMWIYLTPWFLKNKDTRFSVGFFGVPPLKPTEQKLNFVRCKASGATCSKTSISRGKTDIVRKQGKCWCRLFTLPKFNLT